MKNILFPTDFSETAHNAFEYALHLAEALNGRITLLHVYPKFPLEWNYPVPPVADVLDSDRVEEALEKFETYQRAAQSRIGKEIDVQLMMEPGSPIEEIMSLSRHPEVDYIVMGTQGATSQEDHIFGSVSAHVIQQSRCPIWVVPESARYQDIKHIMYATTFKDEDMHLMDRLLELADAFEAHVSCVHVEESDLPWYQMEFKFIESMYQRRSHWHLMRFFHFNYPDIHLGLDRFIQETHVDLVSVLTHRRGLVERVFGKSFSKEMVLHTRIPLLVIPGKDQ